MIRHFNNLYLLRHFTSATATLRYHLVTIGMIHLRYILATTFLTCFDMLSLSRISVSGLNGFLIAYHSSPSCRCFTEPLMPRPTPKRFTVSEISGRHKISSARFDISSSLRYCFIHRRPELLFISGDYIILVCWCCAIPQYRYLVITATSSPLVLLSEAPHVTCPPSIWTFPVTYANFTAETVNIWYA
jgi:hypothetical protein